MTSKVQDLERTDEVKGVHSFVKSEEDLDLTNRVLFSHSGDHGCEGILRAFGELVGEETVLFL